MSLSRVPSLVSAGWLKRCICAPKLATAPLDHLRLLETSWEPHNMGHESYLQQHIPTARHYDMNTGVTPSQLKPKDLPNPAVFQDYVRSLGINNDTHVVVYDKGPMFTAARLWFIFKLYGHDMVSVMDGGMKRWLQCSLPVESGQPDTISEGDFTSKEENHSIHKTFNDMVANIRDNKFQIVDVRNPDCFQGNFEEPSPATLAALKITGIDLPTSMQRGHIPRSVNIENDHFIDPVTNCMTDAEHLKQLFADRDIDTHQPLVSLCYNGVSACLVPLAISHIQQQSDVSVYTGSWTEYGQKATAEEVQVNDAILKETPAEGG